MQESGDQRKRGKRWQPQVAGKQTQGEIAYRGREELGLSAADIARHTGVSTSGITMAIEKHLKE